MLVETFPEDLPDTLSFQVRYLKSGAKCWIVELRDLVKMYSAHKKYFCGMKGKNVQQVAPEPEERASSKAG